MDTLLSETSALLPSSHSSPPPPPPARRSHVPAGASFNSSPAARSASTSSQVQPLTHPAAPLPLRTSRSLIPAPLKFLWFRGSSPERRGSEPADLPLDLLSEASAAGDRLVGSSDDVRACTCGADSTSQTQGADGMYWGQNEEAKDVVTPALSASTSGVGRNSVKPFEVSPTTSDQLKQTQESGAARDDLSAGWISRFLNLKSFWKDLRSEQSSVVDPLAGVETANADSDTLENGCHVASVCDLEGLQGCLLKGAHERVVHDRESVSAFLQEVPVFEVKTILQMCSLSNLAYIIPRIKTRELFKHHRLMFITSSLAKKAEAEAQAKDRLIAKKQGVKCKEMKVLGDLAAADVGEVARSDPVGAAKPKMVTPKMKAELMATIESDAQAILKDAGTVLNKPFTLEGGPVTSSRMLTEVEDVDLKQPSISKKQASSRGNCPCEWFICDDESSHVRYLVIQGSESLASWKTNLAFDPTRFEALGIMVHRGIYEAAKGLYEMVLPEILNHLRAHGELAQLRFTGHSLGGSLATLLALMLLIRGVITPTALLPVVTFGSPCVLCGGDSLLQKLSLKVSQFMSVVMHRDIVPRAFACDYPDHAAQILKRLNGTFREHPCLNHQKLLYAPMGQMLILQPDPTHSPGHPLLPSGGGLYLIRHPSNEQDRNKAIQLLEAQRDFMNRPHPLEVLRDPGAYGFEGAISRDHDPRSYAKAIKVVIRLGLKRMRRIRRDWRRQLWWPLVTAEASLLARKAGINTDINPIASGAASSALSKSSIGCREMVTCAIAECSEFPRSNIYLSRSRKFIMNRYARLIASRHVHMGLLLILSTRITTLVLFSAFLAFN